MHIRGSHFKSVKKKSLRIIRLFFDNNITARKNWQKSVAIRRNRFERGLINIDQQVDIFRFMTIY